MNVLQLIEYMDFMMNVKEDIILNFGNFLLIVLIVLSDLIGPEKVVLAISISLSWLCRVYSRQGV